MIGMIWAVLFDWADGLIARRMKDRTGNDSIFGGQLDLLIDIVSYGVAPVVLLLSYGKFDPLLLPVAFVVLAAGAMRLSYFSTYGLNDESRYTGLAIDNNNIALVLIFTFESLLPYGVFLVILTASTLCLAALNVSQIKTPKLSGKSINVFLLVAYTIGLTLFYGWKLSQ